ncbi:hypothetical protein AKO1_011090 [Acrasis kona]|uniref:Homeobox domain-containing protein n=1 Tax=Acrasis kona TaxID=1008807 RepID=A0AAW2YU17_9EUKA
MTTCQQLPHLNELLLPLYQEPERFAQQAQNIEWDQRLDMSYEKQTIQEPTLNNVTDMVIKENEVDSTTLFTKSTSVEYTKQHEYQNKSKIKAHQEIRLRTWLRDNINNPYPSKRKKTILAEELGMTEEQVNNWLYCRRKKHNAHHKAE